MSPPQNKKPRYTPRRNSNKQFLAVGQKGFLATCNFREKDCIRECYNLLNEYADEMYGPEKVEVAQTDKEINNDLVQNSNDEDDGDIADELQREIQATVETQKKSAGNNKRQRFSVADTAVMNCIFIKTNLENPIEVSILPI